MAIESSTQTISTASHQQFQNGGPPKTQDAYAQYYPSHWPANPFHPGEVQMQREAGVHEKVMSYAPRVVRPFMPEQHSEFYQAQPFLVAAGSDSMGHMWATLLTHPTGEANMTTSSDPATLQISTRLVRDDALQGALIEGSDLGLLGIEFATKRRNRVNGRIVKVSAPENNSPEHAPVLTFRVDQAFGNCPQYIKPRKWWTAASRNTINANSASSFSVSSEARKYASGLTENQMKRIQRAETIFVATGYRGEGEDPRFGNDASHRGGPAGFLKVKDSKTLILPEFAGNNHFNTLGNLVVNSRMGITLPFWEEGGMLQLSGTASLETDMESASKIYPGALRLITFHIEHVNEVSAGSLPIRWSADPEMNSRQVQVSSIIQESANVKSFHLRALPTDARPLDEFTSGQHLPIRLNTQNGELLRTYSLSGSPDDSEYRISVKLEPHGKASNFLHRHLQVGDIFQVDRPAGDFLLKMEEHVDGPLVLISSGIGITPILSMLHEAKRTQHQTVYWIYGTQDGRHHPFRVEVENVFAGFAGNAKKHIVYSKPNPEDVGLYDSTGHIDANLVSKLIPDLKNADVFMCGNAGFMAAIEKGLQLEGVKPSRIHYETF